MRKHWRLAAGLLLASVPTVAQAELNVYFGNLHAHSNLSDGNKSISPREAYRIAREEGGLDFMSLSEHNHYLTTAEMSELMKAAKRETKSGFVALFGQEYSTIDPYNHTNIQNYPHRIPGALNGEYKKVFSELLVNHILTNPEAVVYAGFNHPQSRVRDYGLSSQFGGDIDAFVAALDPFVQLIAIGNGPSDSGKKSFQPTTTYIHRDVSTSAWFDYLSYGMHLAPKIDHDTHSPTYGFRVAGRTAAWVDGNLNTEKLITALASRHVYATEDANLRILPTVEGGYLPGDIVVPDGNGDLSVSLNLSDPDEPDATYSVYVYSGFPGSGERPTSVAALKQQNVQGTVSLELPVETGIEVYYVLKVVQIADDPLNGSPRDDSWLAPIWVEWGDHNPWEDDPGLIDEEPAIEFVGSRHSEVYHLPSCRWVERISPHNLMEYESVPAGKRLHTGCPTP